MSETGTFSTIQAVARLVDALKDGPLTMYAAVLLVADLDARQYKGLTKETRAYWRSRTRSILDSISHPGGLCIAEHTQGNTTIYFIPRS